MTPEEYNEWLLMLLEGFDSEDELADIFLFPEGKTFYEDANPKVGDPLR